MNDLKQRLQRAADAVPESHLDLDRLDRARNRHETKRRIGGAVVGLSILVALAVGLVSVLPATDIDPATNQTDVMPTPSAQLHVDDGEYAYEEGAWVTFGDDGVVTKVAYPEQVWYGPNASGVRINEGEKPQIFGPSEYQTDAGDLSYLSTDPAVLREQIIERTKPGGASPEPYDGFTTGAEAPLTAGLVRAIGELLDDDNSTPALRAGLAQVLAGLEGAQVDVSASDPAGRATIELQIESERQLHVWWFDPQSLQVTAWTNVDPGVDASTARIVYIVSGAGIVGTDHEELPTLPLVDFATIREGQPIAVDAPVVDINSSVEEQLAALDVHRRDLLQQLSDALQEGESPETEARIELIQAQIARLVDQITTLCDERGVNGEPLPPAC